MLSRTPETLKSKSKTEHQRTAMDSSRDDERKLFVLHLHGYIHVVLSFSAYGNFEGL